MSRNDTTDTTTDTTIDTTGFPQVSPRDLEKSAKSAKCILFLEKSVKKWQFSSIFVKNVKTDIFVKNYEV